MEIVIARNEHTNVQRRAYLQRIQSAGIFHRSSGSTASTARAYAYCPDVREVRAAWRPTRLLAAAHRPLVPAHAVATCPPAPRERASHSCPCAVHRRKWTGKRHLGYRCARPPRSACIPRASAAERLVALRVHAGSSRGRVRCRRRPPSPPPSSPRSTPPRCSPTRSQPSSAPPPLLARSPTARLLPPRAARTSRVA